MKKTKESFTNVYCSCECTWCDSHIFRSLRL